MRGTQLSVLLAMLKAEMGSDTDSNVAPGADSLWMSVLGNQQKWLATEMDWPFLELRADVTLVPGTRYYNFPVIQGFAFDLSSEILAQCYWSTYWNDIRMGINIADFNSLNPDLNVRVDPVRAWQLYNSGAGATTQFEVWPLPATATQLRLTGQRVLNPLVASTDTADLDDMLIVLFTAAELLQRMNQQDAPAKLSKAQKLLARLRGGMVAPTEIFNIGAGRGQTRRDWEGRPTVAVNFSPPANP